MRLGTFTLPQASPKNVKSCFETAVYAVTQWRNWQTHTRTVTGTRKGREAVSVRIGPELQNSALRLFEVRSFSFCCVGCFAASPALLRRLLRALQAR